MIEQVLSPNTLFDAWAGVYDEQPNPLLALEERVLAPMLAGLRGLDILDAGCGTGRWLEHLADRSPRSVTGVDVSSDMLAAAQRKIGGRCELKLGSCTALPVSDESMDLLLSSFTLSYVDHVEACAAEAYRVLRPGGSFYLSDMHPETEAALDWKRSFTLQGAEMLLESHHWRLPYIIKIFERQGFRLAAQREPQFGAEEWTIFDQRGKTSLWSRALGHPAIYVLKWRKPASAPRLRAHPPSTVVPGTSPRKDTPGNSPSAGDEGTTLLALRNGKCAIGPERAEPATLTLADDRIQSVVKGASDSPAGLTLDCSGCLLLPGLINAHDHLEFALFPRLGRGPYRNAGQWAEDIHQTHAETIAGMRRLPRSNAVWWGAIRNLLSGVTTVCHHNPLAAEMTAEKFPVRVIGEFAWAHSRQFDPQLAEKFDSADPAVPFILHAAEGIDPQSEKEIFALDQMGVLCDRTLLVHALACSQRTIELINRRRATVILCPTSNQFLFQRTLHRASIQSLHSVILGSDSPLTASGDLLDEIQFAHHSIGLDAGTIYRMVTTQAAQALHLTQGQGTLAPGALADILILRDTGLTPADTLVQTTPEQIEAVILSGRVQLASTAFRHRLPPELAAGLEPVEVDGSCWWMHAPVAALLATAEHYLAKPIALAGKRVRHVDLHS